MNKRTIAKVLGAKHEKFVMSIDDPEIRKLVRKHSIITGGCITSMLLGEAVNDFDYYFTDVEAAAKIAQYFVDKFKREHPLVRRALTVSTDVVDNRVLITTQAQNSQGHEIYFETSPEDTGTETEKPEIEPEEYTPVYLTSNAITLSDKVQLIIRFQGTASEIHANFDFAHCTNWWDSATGVLHLNQEALECTLARQLLYRGSLFPVCSVIRTRKFIQRGWKIDAGQYLKMCFQISELDLKDLDVLNEQLVGVDSEYFLQVISYCEQAKAAGKIDVISTTYLVSVIDKIFGGE